MFSFKRKDKDKDKETKEERRERRKKEKEREKIRHEKRHEISNIVAGVEYHEDSRKGLFSFGRRSGSKKYDVEHGYDGRNHSPVTVQGDLEGRNSHSGSIASTGSGSASPTSIDYGYSIASKQPAPARQFLQKDEKPAENLAKNGTYQAESDEDELNRPIPKPRKAKYTERKHSSSIEIKLGQKRDLPSYGSATSNDSTIRNDFTGNSKSWTVVSDSCLENEQNEVFESPQKTPRVQADRLSGFVELKLVNVGSSVVDGPKVPKMEDHSAEKPIETEIISVSKADDTLAMDDNVPDLWSTSNTKQMSKAQIPKQDINTTKYTSTSSPPISPTSKSFEEMGVDLKLPEVKPAEPGLARIVRIKRRASGDFGFALRRGNTPGENAKMVLFIEPVGADSAQGLLPGDQLVEVNGVNVENVEREKIIEMIAMSGNEVIVKVIPVPELSELSTRSGLDGSTIQLDESNLRAGTLQRSGSKRIKKKQAKSEDELASQKAWLDAEKVWVVHKAGFAGGKVQRKKQTGNSEEVSMCKVKLDHGGEIISVEEDSIEKANPPQYDRAEDLASLRFLNESSCLHTLRQRYGSNLIHSYAGPNLVVINPSRQLSIYTDKVIQMFHGCKQEDMPPHIFALVQTAYRNMLATRVDQSIVLLGHSGSGKSTCMKHVLQYLCAASTSQHSAITEQKSEAVFALLDAFGNVQTSMNHDATRFTLLLSLDFDAAGMMTCGLIQTFLLEKSRVVRQPDGETTFKIFNYLLAGADAKLRKDFHLDSSIGDLNDFMAPYDPKSPDVAKHSEKWTEIEFALQMLEISGEEARGLWCILAAIYHLGSATINVGADNKPFFCNPAAVQRAATCLGTTPEEIGEIIFAPPAVNQFTIRVRHSASASNMSPPSSTSSSSSSPEKQGRSTVAGYIEALEGFAMGLYQEVFAALVRLINRSLQCNIHSVTTMHLLDSPGFQNPASIGRNTGAIFEELCHNYENERLQKFFHHTVFTAQMERYKQENIECNFETVATSPDPVVSVFDKAAQSVTRGSTLDLKNEQKGLLWILDEESIFPGASDSSFLARLYVHHSSEKESWVKQGSQKDTFIIQHCQGTLPIQYNAKGWLRLAREHSSVKQVHGILTESSRTCVSGMYQGHRSATEGILRSRSFRKAQLTMPTAIKKNSQCLQLIYQVDTILELIRKTQVNFVRCILPAADSGQYDSNDPISSTKAAQIATQMNVPLVRQQLRAGEMLDAVRIHRQGYPEHMTFGEFRRRFDILAPVQTRNTGPVLDEKKAVETLLEHLELDMRSYRLGLSQIFFRAGTLAQLEDARDEKTTDTIVALQARCRGFLGRQKFKKLQVQNTAIKIIQRNLRNFVIVKNWSWWRLYTKVLPLLDVHRTEEELKSRTGEVEALKAKIAKLEQENKGLKDDNDRYLQKVSELADALSDERTASSQANEALETEAMERMRLERQLKALQDSVDDIKKKKEQLEIDLLEARSLSASATRTVQRLERVDGEGASDEDDSEEDQFYRERYLQASREQEQLRKKIQSQAEEEVEEIQSQKRHLERMLNDANEENEDLGRQISGLKKKSNRLTSEMEDLRLLLENEQTRNADLEKKQRRFDAEIALVKEEVNHERIQKEKMSREKDKYVTEKFRLEGELRDVEEELEKLKKENTRLKADVADVGKHGVEGGDAALRKAMRDLEDKIQEQEEELDEQAGQIQMLEQAKIRIEMAAERDKNRMQKDLENREEEMEEMKYHLNRKIKQLEAQVEDEYQEKSIAVKGKRDAERRLIELRDQFERGDAENEKKLKRELKKTKALLKDAQLVIENQSAKYPKERNQMKALKNKLEDAEFAALKAQKAKMKLEEDIKDLQGQYDSISKGKKDAENRYMTLLKENTELTSKIEEDEDDIENLTQKNRSLMQQLSQAQAQLRERESEIHDMMSAKETLESKVQSMELKLSYLEDSTVEKPHFDRMSSKMKELENRLEMETSFKRRQEVQVSRLKEQVEKLANDKEQLQFRETQLTQENARMERNLRELKEELATLEKQGGDQKQRKQETEDQIEALEAQLALTKQELNLANKRVSELQHALEEDMHSDDDDDDDDDDDEPFVNLDDITTSEDEGELSDSRPSEPKSYQSYDDLDDDVELSTQVRNKLHDLVEKDDELKNRVLVGKNSSENGISSREHTSVSDTNGHRHRRKRSSDGQKNKRKSLETRDSKGRSLNQSLS